MNVSNVDQLTFSVQLVIVYAQNMSQNSDGKALKFIRIIGAKSFVQKFINFFYKALG